MVVVLHEVLFLMVAFIIMTNGRQIANRLGFLFCFVFLAGSVEVSCLCKVVWCTLVFICTRNLNSYFKFDPLMLRELSCYLVEIPVFFFCLIFSFVTKRRLQD